MDRWDRLKRWLIDSENKNIDNTTAILFLSKMREIEEEDRRESRAIYCTSFDGEE